MDVPLEMRTRVAWASGRQSQETAGEKGEPACAGLKLHAKGRGF